MNKDTPFYLSKKFINIGIIAAIIFILLVIILAPLASTNNTYVNKQEVVATAKSNISKEEQRRIDLFNNLADAVKSAKNFEQDTLTQIATARSQANKGNVEQAQITLQSVVEAYPEIKSTALYSQTMLEFSATENRLAQYREVYNTDARDYNQYIRGFWSGIRLSILGKDKTPAPYLDYKTDNSQARDLFDE